jgi:hypothetical protein
VPLQCLKKNPNHRASAMTLLDFPWLAMHGAVDLDSSVEIVRQYLEEQGFIDETAGAEMLFEGK